MRNLLVVALCAALPLAACDNKKKSAAGAGSGSGDTTATAAATAAAGDKLSAEDCDKVAEKMVQLAKIQADGMGEDMKPQILEMIPQIRDEVKQRCRDDGWTREAFTCIMTAKDPDAVEACRSKVPGADEPTKPEDLDMPNPEIPTNPICDPVAEAIIGIALKEIEAEGKESVEEVQGMLGEIRKEVLLRCTLEEWNEEIRSCFTSAKVSDDFLKCQTMLPEQ